LFSIESHDGLRLVLAGFGTIGCLWTASSVAMSIGAHCALLEWIVAQLHAALSYGT